MEVIQKKNRNRLKTSTPAWIVTFADLATLLLTFFILLLSFAEMDVDKYRAMANSMAGALGSDNVVGQEVGGSPMSLIESDTLSVNYDEQQVVIRFSEEATFRSGEANIKPAMIPIIERVVDVLAECRGNVFVSGYTDDRPISSSRFRSNWDLSAARAVSVVHELVLNRQVPAERVVAAGRAETNPLAPNNSPENRALNRRVEIAIRDPQCTDSTPEREPPVEILP